MAVGCYDAPPPTPVASCNATSGKSGQETSDQAYGLQTDDKIDFIKDILPILSSNKDDEVYKCTTCHAGYTKEETFEKKEKIDGMINQVEELKMPLNGDEMRKEQIDIIKKWRDQKFPVDQVNPDGDNNDKKPDPDTDWNDDDWQKNGKKKPSTKPSSGC